LASGVRLSAQLLSASQLCPPLNYLNGNITQHKSPIDFSPNNFHSTLWSPEIIIMKNLLCQNSMHQALTLTAVLQNFLTEITFFLDFTFLID